MKHRYAHLISSRLQSRKPWHILLGVCLLIILCTALVQADTPPPTYYACVKNNTGTLKIVSVNTNCPTGTYKIFWDQIGPQGPVGPSGPQGSSGLSHGYSAVNNTVQQYNNGPVQVVTLNNLPSGYYIVTAFTALSIGTYVTCVLNPDSNSPQSWGDTGGSVSSERNFVVTDGINITGGTISLQCNGQYNEGFGFQSASITAVAVDALN